MSDFYDVVDEYLGDDDALSDIRVVVRKCWFYDFTDYPVRLWDGQGKLFTTDGEEWLGSIGPDGINLHKTPALQDGRDGTSATYSMTLNLYDIPGTSARELYEELKTDQWRVSGRTLKVMLVVFKEGEALRPETPITFFKELTMLPPKFSETQDRDDAGRFVKRYSVTVPCKDGNIGRSNVPNGTYADTIQKQRARELGVTLDRGCEFLALLANRTFQIP